MKNTIKTSVGIVFSVLVLVGGLFAVATPADALTCNDATLTGTVTVVNSPTWARFVYSTNYNTVANSGGNTTASEYFYNYGTQPIEAYIAGLSENTTYYYRLIVSDYTGNYPANIEDFTTPYCQSNYDEDVYVDLSASDTSIDSGDRVTLSWDSDNADYCDASWSSVSEDTDGNDYVYPTSTRTYSITCYGDGDSDSDSVTVYVEEEDDDEDVYVDLSASDTSIDSGDRVTLSWDSDNADYRDASWSSVSENTDGNDYVYPTSTRTYSITCYGDGDSDSDSVTVYVEEDNDDEDVYVDLSASDTSIDSGDRVTLSWDSDNADYCDASWSSVSENTDGNDYVYPTSTRTYSITCYGDGDSDSDSVTVYVEEQEVVLPAPTINLYADQSTVSYNGATTLRWSTTNAINCYATSGSNGWEGVKSIGPATFYTGSLNSTKTYALACSNGYTTTTATKTITVLGPTNIPTPPTSLVLVSSSIDLNQPVVPTIDNTNPQPGDIINYTISYQNIGTSAITDLVLRVNLPYEVNYLSSSPVNPSINGNSLTFSLGTLRANSQGVVTIKVQVRDNIPEGTYLNFPAVLSYIDPSGNPQSVNANVTAQVWSESLAEEDNGLVASVFGAGFFPENIFGWLLFLILLAVLILLLVFTKSYVFGRSTAQNIARTTNRPLRKEKLNSYYHSRVK